MLAAERRQAVLERLQRDGKIVAAEMVDLLGVSEDTVRRDLRDLASRGLLQRVHGGALPPAPTGNFERRLGVSTEAKAGLANAVLPLLDGASVIVLDGGTSNLEVARRLPPGHDGVVLTNSPPIAAALASHPRAEVVVIGGRLLKPAQVTVGADAVAALQGVRPDVCVLGACSVHPRLGVMDADREEARVKRAMVAVSADVVTLATAEKLGTASSWVVSPLSSLTHLVTDAAAADTAPYAVAGVTVVPV